MSTPATRIVLPDQVGLVAPAASLIVVACIACREEKPAPEVIGGRCLDCRLGAALRPRFDRLTQLMRKQRRVHARYGAHHQGTDDQVGRELRRIWADIAALVPHKPRRVAYLNRVLAQIQAQVGMTASQVERAVTR